MAFFPESSETLPVCEFSFGFQNDLVSGASHQRRRNDITPLGTQVTIAEDIDNNKSYEWPFLDERPVVSGRSQIAMKNRTFLPFIVALLLVGFATGYRLSKISRIDTSKLLNIVGLFYDLLAIVVLNEVLATNAKWKQLSADWMAPATLWAHTVIPLGAAVSALIVSFAHFPSSSIILGFAFGFFLYSIIPLAALEMAVVNPKFTIFKSAESRWRYFGLWLLLSGVALQLVAAVTDLR